MESKILVERSIYISIKFPTIHRTCSNDWWRQTDGDRDISGIVVGDADIHSGHRPGHVTNLAGSCGCAIISRSTAVNVEFQDGFRHRWGTGNTDDGRRCLRRRRCDFGRREDSVVEDSVRRSRVEPDCPTGRLDPVKDWRWFTCGRTAEATDSAICIELGVDVIKHRSLRLRKQNTKQSESQQMTREEF